MNNIDTNIENYSLNELCSLLKIKKVESNEVINEKIDDYIYYFQTSGDWQTVKVPFNEMEAFYRGRKLDKPNFPGAQLDELAFLIGNGKEENFSLEIDKIELH